MKKYSILFALIFALLVFPSAVSAADVNVTCNDTQCTPKTVLNFFPDSEIWYPGKTLVKQIKISNTSGVNLRIGVKATNPQTTGDIDQVIQFTITKSDGSVLWDGSLHSFYASGETTLLSALSNSTSETLDFTAYMYKTATNEYQRKTTTFTMIFGYVYASTPTPSPCTAQKPPVPGGVSVSRTNSTDATLRWDYVSDPYTGFSVSWGTNTNADDVGTRSLGKTNETLVGGLELDFKRYYFKVRAVNGCANGDFGTVVTTGTGPNLLITDTPTPTPTSAQILGTQILGASTEEIITDISATPTPTASTTPVPSNGNVIGVSTQCACIWWQILLGEILAAGLYIWIVRKKKQRNAYDVGANIAVFIVPLFVFRFINSCVPFSFLIFAITPSLWCRFFVMLDAIVLLVMWILLTKVFPTKTTPRDTRIR